MKASGCHAALAHLVRQMLAPRTPTLIRLQSSMSSFSLWSLASFSSRCSRQGGNPTPSQWPSPTRDCLHALWQSPATVAVLMHNRLGPRRKRCHQRCFSSRPSTFHVVLEVAVGVVAVVFVAEAVVIAVTTSSPFGQGLIPPRGSRALAGDGSRGLMMCIGRLCGLSQCSSAR
jgi:hypothetical protein